MHSNDNKPMSCAIYARTAHESAVEIDRQVQACSSRALEIGAEVHFLWADDGVSGMELSENMRHLLDSSRLGGFEYLIIDDEARLSPSVALRLFIKAELSAAGVKIEMVSEPLEPREPPFNNRAFQ